MMKFVLNFRTSGIWIMPITMAITKKYILKLTTPKLNNLPPPNRNISSRNMIRSIRVNGLKGVCLKVLILSMNYESRQVFSVSYPIQLSCNSVTIVFISHPHCFQAGHWFVVKKKRLHEFSKDQV